MKILALEFSSAQRSVAVIQGEPGCEPAVTSELIDTGSRAVPTFAMIAEALGQARFEREQIECLAIGLGPGSYTGIRAAIAVAQGWQLAMGTRLLGISSVECLAAQAREAGCSGPIRVLIDAQRNEFYLGTYRIEPGRYVEVEPLRLVSLAEAKQVEAGGETVIGPDVSRWFPSTKTLFPRAATLPALALKRNDYVPGETLEPIYLRETSFVKAPPPRVVPP